MVRTVLVIAVAGLLLTGAGCMGSSSSARNVHWVTITQGHPRIYSEANLALPLTIACHVARTAAQHGWKQVVRTPLPQGRSIFGTAQFEPSITTAVSAGGVVRIGC